MQLPPYTRALLDDIERRIDPETEEDYRAQWNNFWHGKCTEPVFAPKRKKISPSSTDWKKIHINDALSDSMLMLDAQLYSLNQSLSSSYWSLGMRANYGTGIMPSLFGASIFEMPRETNTLPTTRSFNDSDKIREILEKGIPDFQSGYGKNVLNFGEMCAEILEHYPKIKTYADIYHPDTQGPLDIAELLWGGEMFLEMYDDPEFVHAVLRLITDTYKGFMDKWFSILPPRHDINVHWGVMIRGNILLRLDSAMNLSPQYYEEFSKPYDRELLDYFGGGCLHFCGRGDHYIQSLCDIDSLYGVNLTEPHNNNMETILSAVCSAEKRIFSLRDAQHYSQKPYIKNGLIHMYWKG